VTGRTGLNEGDENTAVGAFAEVGNSTASFSNSTALGFQATATANNQVTLGNLSVTSVVTKGKLTTFEITYPNTRPKLEGSILTYTGNGLAEWRTAQELGLAASFDGAAFDAELLALRQEVERQREELMAIIERQQQQIAALERVVSMEQFAAR